MANRSHCCRIFPSLERAANLALYFLVWSATVHERPQVLCEQAKSMYDRLHPQWIQDVQSPQPLERLALTLAAWRCCLQLQPFHPGDETLLATDCSLANFNALVNGTRHVNEKMVLNNLLCAVLNNYEMHSILAPVMHMIEPVPDINEDLWRECEYIKLRKEAGLSHQEAYANFYKQ